LCASCVQAASLLKKTEGVVTLVVCNPNKAKEEEKNPVEADIHSPTPTPQPSVTAAAAAVAAAVPPISKELDKPSEYHTTTFHSLLCVWLVCLAVILTDIC
jgi:hypothetical protein